MTILAKIIEQKEIEVEVLKKKFWTSPKSKAIYISKIEKSEISFYNALLNRFQTSRNDEIGWPRLIAEVKKGSPSQGLIRGDFDVAQIVKLYDKYAAAMSILTDEKFFLGSLENLKIARKNTKKPLLRKDFILDEFQIYEACFSGANAVLLLASVLNTAQIQNFLDLTHSLGMDALVEVHDEKELESVLQTDAKIIGINNRNLKDFSIDLENSNRLARLIPKDRIVVSESGINSISDIRKIRKNADAILVGTAITKNQNMEGKIREISGIPQVKICGITNLEDAQAVLEMKADYLGFIFYEKSPRNIESEKCAKIIKKLKEISLKGQRKFNSVEAQDFGQSRMTKLPIKFVGVFVNEKIEEVLKIVEECGLDVVQLHGEESFDEVENLKLKVRGQEDFPQETHRKNFKVQVGNVEPTENFSTASAVAEFGRNDARLEIWKAFRVKDKNDLEKINDFKNADGILLDTFHKDAYGGTGEKFEWGILEDFYPDQKLIVAGGLDATNIQDAVNLFHPDVVDVSSKIEEKPGKKDLGKMREFFIRLS